MRRLGKVLHLSKSGNLIVRADINTSDKIPAVGTEVYDSKLTKIGVVNNLLGPVNAPYLSVTPVASLSQERAEGRTAYGLEQR